MSTRESVNSYKEVIIMTNYREILRLKSLGLNNSQIADTGICSRPTVIQVLQLAKQNGIQYPLPKDMSDAKLASILFPSNPEKSNYKMSDYEHVAKELMRDGVTLNLLWLEYCEQCQSNNETPYQLIQFKKYFRDYAAKTSATMHLNHKPGESMQQFKKPALLIIDEWLLYPLKETEARDLLEISEARYKKASTIFCSQFDIPGWREKIGDPIMADAICDRIVHDSYPIIIDCKESMRKRKGVQETND